ncbi:MAG: hypothetical protein ACPHYE_07480, partial [Henriciella sp.]
PAPGKGPQQATSMTASLSAQEAAQQRNALIDAINDKRTPLSDRPDPIECVEQTFDVAALLSAREVFTSSAGAMIVPIVSVDGVTIGDGLPGPVTRRLQAFYYDYVGADPDSLDWLSL